MADLRVTLGSLKRDALKVKDQRLDILKENCEGCGACVCACPEKALRLDNVELIRKLARA